MSKSAAVWIDHRGARIFRVHPEAVVTEEALTAAQHVHHAHPGGGLKEHPEDARRFFHEIASALVGIDQLLLVGPSTAKLEFFRWVHKHEPKLEPKIVGIETVDHPTDAQLVAYAKSYFNRSDAAA
jgi:stalled ribosome rescue protein Dom34